MADKDEESHLLFFDTFSHENTEDLNLDLVQFSRPVLISEIRIIPLGTRVTVDVPGGVRLGATNPSSFKLELFVNNLGIPNSSVFEKLGILEYKENVDIQIISEKLIPTDGLILKGWYATITIAVYGKPTQVTRDQASPPPPPPPQQSRSKPQALTPQVSSPRLSDFQPPESLTGPPQVVADRTPEWSEIVPRPQEYKPPPHDFVPVPVQVPLHQPLQPSLPQHVPSMPLPQHIVSPHLPVEPYHEHTPMEVLVVPQASVPPEPSIASRVLPPEPLPVRDARGADFHDAHEPSDSYDDRRRDRDSRDGHLPREGQERSRSSERDFRGSRENSREPRDFRDRYRDKGRDHDLDSKDRPRPRSPTRRRSWSPDRRRSKSRSRSPLSREAREQRDARESRERGDQREGREQRDTSKQRDSRDVRPPREPREPPDPCETREEREPREGRDQWEDAREPHEAREGQRETREVRDARETRDPVVKPKEPPTPEEETEPGEISEEGDDLFEPLTPDHSPDERIEKMFGALSDGEIPEGEGEGYEEISSGEDNLSDFDGQEIPSRAVPIDWEYEMEEVWDYSLSNFNPYRCELAPLGTYKDPALTNYEICKQQLVTVKDPVMPEAAKQLLDLVATYVGADHHEKWVEAMEAVPRLLVPGLVYLVNKTDHKEVLEHLILWAMEGLDLERAMAQPETAYKVRHLKMGIKLTGALCSCDSFVAFRMLTEDVQEKLIDLYESQYMSSSVKLQIIRTLDQTTRLRDGMDWFLGRHHLQVKMASGGRMTSYQRVLQLMLNKQMVRSMVALTGLMRKVHTYEVLLKLGQTVEMMTEKHERWITENTNVADKEKPLTGLGEDSEIAMETDGDVTLEGVPEEDIEMVINCLEEIVHVINKAENIISQPRRTLHAKVKFAVTAKPYDPYPNLFQMFNATKLLELVFVLLTSPTTASHSAVFVAVREMVVRLLDTQAALLYLSSKPDIVNGITRTLIQQDFSHVEGTDDNPAQQLGLQLTYNLQAIQFIDQLREYHDKDAAEKEIDDADVLVALHNLYSMTFLPVGKDAIIHVFSLEDNLEVLLPFIEFTGDEDHDGRMKKSVCLSYTVLLLLLIVRHSEHVTMLEKYGPKLLHFTEQDLGTGKLADKHAEIGEWLQPLRKVTVFNHYQIPELVKQLQQYLEEISDVPKGLVTSLRILQHLAIPPRSAVDGLQLEDEDEVEQLRYKYALLELYSAGCFDIYVSIITKVGERIQSPWQQGIPQSGRAAAVVVATVSPTLALIRATLSNLILARGPEFRDLTCLNSLYQLHTIMCSVMLTGAPTPDIVSIQSQIVGSLMTFTQPALQAEETEDALSKSLWTLMMKDLFKYVPTSPYTFLGGLMLISELLPLPLPIQTREELSEEEVTLVINQRKLWSAHLHPLTSDVQEVIKPLAGSSCQPLQQVLRRICWQIADLAAPSALTVVRCLMDAVIESMDETLDKYKAQALPRPEGAPEKHEENKEVDVREEVRSSGQTSRILNLLAFVINQAPIKAAFLQLTRPGSKSDERYMELLPRLIHLFNVVSDKLSHMQAQESIASIIQSLCDIEVTLVPGETTLSFMEQVANAMPAREQLVVICSALLDHISQIDHSYSSVLPSLRTLMLLLEHDFGFYHIKSALAKNPNAFFNLFMRINSTFSKDSADCIATLSSAVECIQFMCILPDVPVTEGDEPMTPSPERTLTLSTAEIRSALCVGKDLAGHPLDDLEKLLQEYAKDEEALKAVHESVTAVVLMLQSDTETDVPKPEITEPVLPPAGPLSNQFAMRATYMISDVDDDRLTTAFWLSMPTGDESDQELDLVRCDFEEMSEKHCPEFDLKSELMKGDKDANTQQPKPRRKLRAGRRGQDTINTSRMRGNSNRFVAPMRGRGFGRGMINNNRHDPFRSRPPNTSRPPSMHVDDFVKMENQQHGPNTQGGAPQGGRRQDKEGGGVGGGGGGRGRGGFDRGGRGGFNNRGRFFSPQGNYNRRDGNERGGSGRGGYNQQGQNMGMGGPRGRSAPRGGQRGGQGNIGPSRGGMPNKGNVMMKGPTPWQNRQRQGFGQAAARGFGRGGHDRSASGDRRNSGGEGRFSQRGRGRGIGRGQRDRDMDTRFMPPPMGFQGRRDRGRHQRSHTK